MLSLWQFWQYASYESHIREFQLDDRSRNILQRRWLDDDKSTLHELAAEYNVSAERIRQLEKNAMEKIKVAMSAS